MRDIGGPEKITFEQLAHDVLVRKGHTSKNVVVDAEVGYFGAALSSRSLVTAD